MFKRFIQTMALLVPLFLVACNVQAQMVALQL